MYMGMTIFISYLATVVVGLLTKLLVYQFFMQAKSICPSDPLVYNELGVVAYHMKE